MMVSHRKSKAAAPLDAATESAVQPVCLRLQRDGCILDVSVSPNAKRTEAQGLHDGALRVRLAAPPVDGQANEELIRWVASELGLPLRSIKLLRGQTSRRKQLQVDVPSAQAQAWLTRILGSPP